MYWFRGLGFGSCDWSFRVRGSNRFYSIPYLHGFMFWFIDLGFQGSRLQMIT